MNNTSTIAQNLSNHSWISPFEENIPNSLKNQPFAVWLAEPREGKPGKFNKAPRSPKSGRIIGANKPELFGTFNDALTKFKSGGYTGVGVLLTGNGIVGIDIDDYESIFTNQPSVKEWVETAISMGIYCEYSPSKTGLRLFILGKIGSSGRKSDGLEIYENVRFLTVTGHLFNPSIMVNELIDSQSMIDEFLRLLPNAQNKSPTTMPLEVTTSVSSKVIDGLCLAVEKKEPLLWSGKWQKDKFNVIGYPSHSEGDMALTASISRTAVSMELPESMISDAVLKCFMRSAMYRPEKHMTLMKYTIPKAIAGAIGNVIVSSTQKFNSSGISAAELANKEFAPINWVVQDILPEGAYLLSARPKVGKSWLALQLSLAVSFGDSIWHKTVKRGVAVYLALEENQRRLQTRLSQLREEWGSPDLILHTSWKRSDQGGLEDLEKILSELKPRLVVIDTLAKFRPPSSKGSSAYEGDYNALAPITDMANKYRCCILVVTHNRKGKSEGDAIEMVSGTLGQMGAVDGALIIDGNRGDSMMRLTLVGRDIEHDGEFAITKRQQGGWDWSGSASQAFMSAERQIILNLLKSITSGLKPSEVADRLNKPSGAVRKLMHTMAAEMQIKLDKTGTYSV